ncbi:MAG: DUF4249 domain-containing protein [Bacteroidales bacterium]|nr:DUF4249 domain-containing protein [Bacteroidales bacterium]
MKNIYCLFISLLLIGCENYIEFDLNDNEPELVVNSFIDASLDKNFVSMNILDGETLTQVEDGQIEIFVNQEKKETIRPEVIWYSSNGSKLVKSIINTKFKAGDLVELKAATDDGKYSAYSKIIIPTPIVDFAVDTFYTKKKVNDYMEDCIGYKIHIKDISNEKNYYCLRIESLEYWGDPDNGWEYEPSVSYMQIINNEDVVLTDGHITTGDDEENNYLDFSIKNNYNIFTDSRFRDKSYTMQVYTLAHYKREHIFYNRISLISISEAQYRYFKALNCTESDNYDTAIMEPVILPNNVDKALGFIGSAYSKSIKIRLKN